MTSQTPAAFCPACGHPLQLRHVPEEERERLVCTSCGHIYYINPKVVAGTIPAAEGRIWLLRRAIEPRLGYWTFPAGFMEMGETVEEAAIRETREELNLEISIGRLLNVYSLPHMTTVHIIYRARALSRPTGGKEALEFASFAPGDIPWDDLAFWTTRRALEDWLDEGE
ncbi:MAG: NUDIX hydrolase [Chloroflexi bacterium]|nr:NUDIX hydrolase [Chloroflexota bacterium]